MTVKLIHIYKDNINAKKEQEISGVKLGKMKKCIKSYSNRSSKVHHF